MINKNNDLNWLIKYRIIIITIVGYLSRVPPLLKIGKRATQ